MNKIYQLLIRAVSQPAAGVIPVLGTNVIPVPTANVIPEGCIRESQSCKTTTRLGWPTKALSNDNICEKRLRPPTKTLGGDDVCENRLRPLNPAGRQTPGNDGPAAKRLGLRAKTLSHGGVCIQRASPAGFTLIELLVVVLIIGILAAVALPQYQTAVLKSRTAELFANVRALREASDRYYLANGVRPTDFLDLDIRLPYKTLTDDGGANFQENGKLVMSNGNVYGLDVDGYVVGVLSDGSLYISSWYKSYGIYSSGVRFYCSTGGTERQKKAAQQVCLALGGVFKGEANGAQVYAIN